MHSLEYQEGHSSYVGAWEPQEVQIPAREKAYWGLMKDANRRLPSLKPTMPGQRLLNFLFLGLWLICLEPENLEQGAANGLEGTQW